MSSPLRRVAASSASTTASSAAAESPAGQGETDAAILRNRVEGRLDGVRDLAERQATVALLLRERLAELHSDREHTRAWLQQRETEVRAEAAKALDEMETAAAEALEEVRAQATKAAERKPANAAEAQLLEARIANEWTALRMVLDAATRQSDPLAALEAAAESAAASSPEKAAALRRMGPDWVAATLIGEPRYARQRALDALNAGVARAEEPHLTPLQRQARAILADVQRGADRLEWNSGQVRREVGTHDDWRVAALAGWGEEPGTGRDQVVYLSDRGRTDVPTAQLSANFGPAARAWQMHARRSYPLLAGVPTAQEAGLAWFRAQGYAVGDGE